MRLPAMLCLLLPILSAVGAETPPAPAAQPARPAKPAAEEKRVVFRIPGAQAWEVAARAGWKFYPQGAPPPRDGRNSAAQITPGLNTSLVQGPRMTQMRMPGTWTRVSQNTFCMFADAAGRARQLAEGWKVLDLRLTGQNWVWVTKPKAGGTSPSFAVQLTGTRSTTDTVVDLAELTLEGPAGAKDWRVAFAPPPREADAGKVSPVQR